MSSSDWLLAATHPKAKHADLDEDEDDKEDRTENVKKNVT